MQVQNIFSSIVVRITFCLTLISWHGGARATLPQPGQNIRSVCALIGTEVDALLGTFTVLNADFNATFTALAAVTTLINQDFNFTMTVIAGLSSLITTDFNNTFTALAALGGCGFIPLFQTNVINGGMLLTATGASYCLTQNITGSIIISAADVTVDLNAHSLLGTIDIISTATNATIQNGNVKPVAPGGAIDASHAAIVIASTVDKALITNCYVVCANSTLAGTVGRDGIANGGTNTVIHSCFIQAGAGASGSNGGNGVIVTGLNSIVSNNTIIAGAGTIGGDGVSQQANNGKIINNIVTGGVAGGAGITVTASTNLNTIQTCIATNCGGSGFSMLTTGTVNLLACVANYNTSHGFNLASSTTGRGLINSCVASQNNGCGFNDRVASLYQYIGNSSEGNGSTPAIPTSDSNYCDSSLTSTFVTPSGPGFAPYYQNARRTDGTFNGTSNWDNITLN